MLTALADWQRASLRSWLTLSRAAWTAVRRRQPADRARRPRAAQPRDRRGDRARPRGRRSSATPAARSRCELVLEHPFAALSGAPAPRTAPAPRRRILLAAPYSGYATTVLSRPDRGARRGCGGASSPTGATRGSCRLAAGRFDLADQIALLTRLMRAAGPGLHVVALSQATVPALLAIAALAEAAPASGARQPQPARRADRSAHNPTPPTTCCSRPPPRGPRGDLVPHRRRRPSGRRPPRAAEPASPPAVRRCPPRALPAGPARRLLRARRCLPTARAFLRSLEDLHALIDVPAELVLQVLRDVFHEPRPVRRRFSSTTAAAAPDGDRRHRPAHGRGRRRRAGRPGPDPRRAHV